MQRASRIKIEVPLWVVSHLGLQVELVQPFEGYAPGHRGRLVMIDSGYSPHPTRARSWHPPVDPFAGVLLDENDDSDIFNVPFEVIRPLPSGF